MKKAPQEQSRIADITSGPHAEANPFLLNLKIVFNHFVFSVSLYHVYCTVCLLQQ